MNRYTLDVKHTEDGEAFIELPEDLLAETGWKEGDDLTWTDNHDGSFTLSKSDKQWVMVETVQMFRHRYMVQVPVGKAEWALDTVTCEEAKEFSQHHLGETIVSHRVMSYEDAIKLCDSDNDYAQVWADDRKVEAFFTKEGEKVNG